jgi:hypothetical protein
MSARKSNKSAASARYYGIEFVGDETRALYRAIKDATGLNYVFNLMDVSMREFGKAHGVPFSETYVDDALIFCCIQLGIDYKAFPHNTPKLSIDGFLKLAKERFPEWRVAENAIQLSVQRQKLWDLWTAWIDSTCDCGYDSHISCHTRYERVDMEQLAKDIGSANAKRVTRLKKSDPAAFAGLRLVHSRD